MYRNIMVPLDGSAEAEEALSTAADIARRADATLHIVRVTGWNDQMEKGVSSKSADSEVNNLASRLAAGFGIRTVAETLFNDITGVDYIDPPIGVVAGTLVEYMSHHAIDLCVMITHGRGATGRALFGSVADELLHQATVPCLLMKHGIWPANERPPLRAKRVLVPVDLGLHDVELLRQAEEMGALFSADFTLIHVLGPMALPVAIGTAELMDSVELARSAARERLTQLASNLSRGGRPAHAELVTMPFAASGIIDYAIGHSFDVIVTATRGFSGIRRAILGSVATTIVHRATMPVLVCPSEGHRVAHGKESDHAHFEQATSGTT